MIAPIFMPPPQRPGAVAIMGGDSIQQTGPAAQAFVILDPAPDAMWVARADLQIIYANAAAARLFGRSRTDLVGRSATAFQPDAEAQDAATGLAELLAGETHLRQGHIMRSDGTLVATKVPRRADGLRER
jgi:PAS domain S-box-containing protein